MAYTLNTSLALGTSKFGLADLRAQLVDSAGVNVGGAVTVGFVEVGTSGGNYLWTYAAFPDGFRGGVKFYRNADGPDAVLAFAAVNPEEVGGLLDGAITDAKFTFTANPATPPTGPVGWLQWLAARMGLRRVVRDASQIRVKRVDGTTDWTANAYTAGSSAEDVGAAV